MGQSKFQVVHLQKNILDLHPNALACTAQDANLWDVSLAPTIVMTQRGARSDFQKRLAARGVEVVEFDFLTPDHVAAYCYERGFLQVRAGG